MKRRFPKVFTGFLVLLLFCPAVALGAGFALFENGAKPLAMGGAFAAQADDPSALFYNPAGITQLPGTHLSVGTTVISPGFEYSSETPGKSRDMEDQTFFPSTVYYSQQLSDRIWWGVGFFSPFGLGTKWPRDWEGRYISVEGDIQTFEINPNIAMKAGENGAFSVGVAILYLDALISKMIPFDNTPTQSKDIYQELNGDGVGYGANFAYHYKGDSFRFGVTARSPIKIRVTGDVTFDHVDTTTASLATGLTGPQNFPNTGASTYIELPGMITGGVAYTFFERLTCEFDLQWTDWSTYDTLDIELDKPLFGVKYVSENPKHWNDVWAFRFGAQYQVTDALALRAGYVYDQSPIPDSYLDTLLPGNDRQLYSVGAGYKIGNFTVDLTYVYWDLEQRTKTTTSSSYGVGLANHLFATAFTLDQPAAGTYEADAHFIGLQISYAF